MKTAIIVINKKGFNTAVIISEYLGNTVILENKKKGELPSLTAEAFSTYEGIIFIMAAGIVVRMIAPHITDKYHDPAVVVLDDAKRYAVSLLSGHEGGANMLAYRVAAAVGAEPVITTGTETNKSITVGIGCRKGTKANEITEAVEEACRQARISTSDIRTAASISIKKNETGLITACEEIGIPIRFFSKEQINNLCADFEPNEIPLKKLGVKAVAEPCALLAGTDTELIVPKKIYGKVTIAIALERNRE